MLARQVAPYIPILFIPGAFIWFALVAIFTRPFGVNLPITFSLNTRRKAMQVLPFLQYVLVFGVLNWGCLMLIYTTTFDYLDWKFWNGSYDRLSVGRILVHAVVWLGAGVLLGILSWERKKSRAAQLSN